MNTLTQNCTRTKGLQKLIEHYKCKCGIEIGVREAWLSKFLIQNTNLCNLIGLDINHCPDAVNLERVWPTKYHFTQNKSPDYAQYIPDKHFDFIHIDADHHYEAVKKDLEAWWPKLSIGGVLSGDDYTVFTSKEEGEYGVVQAVNEFSQENNLELFVIGYDKTDIESLNNYAILAGKRLGSREIGWDTIPNWYFIKDR